MTRGFNPIRPIPERMNEVQCRFSSGADATSPLALFVHGRAGHGRVMDIFAHSIPHHWGILSFQAPVPDPLGGFSWWLVDDQQSPLVDNVLKAATLFEQSLHHAHEECGIRPKGVVGVGFSQGAGLLSYVIQTRIGLLQAYASLAGFVIPIEAPNLPQSFPCFFAHGENDAILPIAKAREGAVLLEKAGANIEFHADAVGHKVGPVGMRMFRSWLQRLDESFSSERVTS